jgi:mRNA deadenylase 3'-5' endonuclease subunit Ccr4
MELKIVTYNVLADVYLLPERYPDSPQSCMGSRRTQALVAKVVSIDADVICMQEVESTLYKVLCEALEPLGYSGWLELRGGNAAEGCALFHRRRILKLSLASRFDFPELCGSQPCHRLAQIAIFDAGKKPLAVANTHLQWDPPATARSACRSQHQVASLLKELGNIVPYTPTVICGDFNAEAKSQTVSALLEQRFQFGHAGEAMTPTCRANGRCRMIDFIFHSPGISASPSPIEPIDSGTPMPGVEHPSDHVPVTATLVLPGCLTIT